MNKQASLQKEPIQSRQADQLSPSTNVSSWSTLVWGTDTYRRFPTLTLTLASNPTLTLCNLLSPSQECLWGSRKELFPILTNFYWLALGVFWAPSSKCPSIGKGLNTLFYRHIVECNRAITKEVLTQQFGWVSREFCWVKKPISEGYILYNSRIKLWRWRTD